MKCIHHGPHVTSYDHSDKSNDVACLFMNQNKKKDFCFNLASGWNIQRHSLTNQIIYCNIQPGAKQRQQAVIVEQLG